jgi:hypothetical protein
MDGSIGNRGEIERADQQGTVRIYTPVRVRLHLYS